MNPAIPTTCSAALSAAGSPFHQVLAAFYLGVPDPRPTAFLKDHP